MYLAQDPASLVFSYGQYRKPALALPTGERSLQFNLSHSGSLGLLAVTRGRQVGVDVEEVRDLPDLYLIEDRLFAPHELAHQQSRPPEERQLEFFRRWTQREALGKARGTGLDSAAPIATDSVPASSHVLDTWAMRPVEPAAGYVGTVAFAGGPARLGCYRWDESLSLAAFSPDASAA